MSGRIEIEDLEELAMRMEHLREDDLLEKRLMHPDKEMGVRGETQYYALYDFDYNPFQAEIFYRGERLAGLIVNETWYGLRLCYPYVSREELYSAWKKRSEEMLYYLKNILRAFFTQFDF